MKNITGQDMFRKTSLPNKTQIRNTASKKCPKERSCAECIKSRGESHRKSSGAETSHLLLSLHAQHDCVPWGTELLSPVRGHKLYTGFARTKDCKEVDVGCNVDAQNEMQT